MQRMQYAQMSTSLSPYQQSQHAGEQAMGGLMNRAAAAAPLAVGGAALLGLDPIGMGFRAGSMASGMGMGLGGSAMVGAGVAMPLLAAGAVGTYAGGQMMQGAQEQQQLNQMLRATFHQRSPYGQGFTSSGMSQIGSSMRAMTTEFGPQGEVTSFNELSRLASNMGRMGMTTGVRDAREFNERFRQMVSTLKEVATEMSTSLEEAQKMMQSLRGSGVFGMGSQRNMLGQMRAGALSGGLAMSELTGMANIGSQISRMYGGLGRQGAAGGVEAITQIGTAQQIGALSEEDIYNATGLTGAEGRRAFATRMMQHTGRFLKRGKGRYFLASVAGEDGELNEENVEDWMYGGMSVGETRKNAYKNLAGVGRANFIRNEGRLRGAVMEKFGGLAPTMALMSWARGRGVDVNDMDDRAMLFAQRQLGFGRDEMDAAVKMAQRLPEIMRERRLASEDDDFLRGEASYRSQHGIEGIQKRIDQAKAKVQSKLRKVGQDIFTSGSEALAEWFNKTMDVYEERMTDDIDRIWQNAGRGGAGSFSDRAYRSSLGIGGESIMSERGGSLGGARVNREGLMGDMENRRLRRIASAGAAQGARGSISGFDTDSFSRAYTGSLGTMAADARVETVAQKALSGAYGEELKKQFQAATSKADKVRLVARMEGAAGIAGEAQLSNQLGQGGGPTRTLLGGARTIGAGDREAGLDILGGRDRLDRARDVIGTVQGGAGDLFRGGIYATVGISEGALRAGTELMTGYKTSYEGTVTNRLIEGTKSYDNLITEFGASLYGKATGIGTKAQASGAYLRSSEGSRLGFGMMTGSADSRQQSRREMQKEIQRLNAKQNRTTEENGQLETMKRMLLASEYGEIQASGSTDYSSVNQMAADMGVRGSMESNFMAISGALTDLQGANRARVYRRELRRAEKAGAYMEDFGIATVDDSGRLKLSAGTEKELAGIKSADGREAAEIALQMTNAALNTSVDPRQALSDVQDARSGLTDALKGMTVADKKKFASAFTGTDVGRQAREMAAQHQRSEAIYATASRRDQDTRAAVAGRMLGVDIDRDVLRSLKGRSDEQVSAYLGKRLGLEGDDPLAGKLQEAVKTIGQGKAGLGGATEDLQDILTEIRRKKKDEDEAEQDRQKNQNQQMADSLQNISKASDQSLNVLRQIANNTATADPEKGGT